MECPYSSSFARSARHTADATSALSIPGSRARISTGSRLAERYAVGAATVDGDERRIEAVNVGPLIG